MNYTALCLTAAFLADNASLRGLLIARILIAFCGTILIAVLLCLQGRYLALHKNAQVLLICHHLWVIVHCVTSIGMNSFDINRYSHIHSNSCDYLIPMNISAPIRGAFTVSYYGNVWALLAMTLERLIATYNYQTYEREGRYYWSCILVAAQVYYD